MEANVVSPYPYLLPFSFLWWDEERNGVTCLRCSRLEVCGGVCSILVVHQQRRCDLPFDLLLTKFRECTSKYYLAESQFWTSGSPCFLDVLLNLNFGVKFANPAMNK